MEIDSLLDIINNKKELFQDYDNLIISLKKLDSVIGMEKLKLQVFKQIKTFIDKKDEGDYKNHCLLTGPPGCDKTTIGKILCEIWIAIGFIKKNKDKDNNFNQLRDELIEKNKRA